MPPIDAAPFPQPPADPRAASPLLRIKFVYYGPSGVGKTATLRRLAARLRPSPRDRLLLLDRPGAPTALFDQLSLSLPVPGGHVLLNLYSVPGEPMQRPMRRLLLRGADAVIWVDRPTKDAQPAGSTARQAEVGPDELRDNLRDALGPTETLAVVTQPSPFDSPADEPIISALRCALAALWPRVQAQRTAGSLPDDAPGLAACDDALLQALGCRRSTEPSTRLAIDPRPQAMAALLALPVPPATAMSHGARPV